MSEKNPSGLAHSFAPDVPLVNSRIEKSRNLKEAETPKSWRGSCLGFSCDRSRRPSRCRNWISGARYLRIAQSAGRLRGCTGLPRRPQGDGRARCPRFKDTKYSRSRIICRAAIKTDSSGIPVSRAEWYHFQILIGERSSSRLSFPKLGSAVSVEES